MRGPEALRAAIRAQSARNLGVDPKLYRGFGTRVEITGAEAQVFRLPVQASPPLQDEDGTPFFMVGVSDPFEEHVVQ